MIKHEAQCDGCGKVSNGISYAVAGWISINASAWGPDGVSLSLGPPQGQHACSPGCIPAAAAKLQAAVAAALALAKENAQALEERRQSKLTKEKEYR